MNEVYQNGNTVRLLCTFRDFEDNITSPQLTKIIFYDGRYEKKEEISIGDSNKLSDGSYFYDYIVPNGSQVIYYEWYGEINGLPAIKRDGFMTKFI